MALNKQTRRTMVDRLVTNCACQVEGKKVKLFGEKDRAAFNELSDEELIGMDKLRQALARNEEIVAKATAGFKHGSNEYKYSLTANKFVTNACGSDMHDEEADSEEDSESDGNADQTVAEDEEEEKPGDPKKAMGVANKETPMTEAEWLRKAPKGIRTILLNAQRQEQAKRNKLIETLTDNSDFTADELQGFDTDKLAKMAKMMARQPAFNEEADGEDGDHDSYFGAAPAINQSSGGVATKQEDMLIAPTINWEEEAASRERRNMTRAQTNAG